MAHKLKFAILGSGRIGRRHASMVKFHNEAELVAMIDVNEALRAELEEEFDCPYFNSLEEYLKSDIKAEIMNICTPNYLHAPQAITAINHGHHVVVEKPMALTKAEAEELIHQALQNNRQVFCVMQNRYSPPAKWLKEVVSSGVMGEIYMVNINCFWNRDDDYYKGGDPNYWKGKQDKDGGTLFTQFSHFVDTMYWLMGDITNIKASFYDFNHQKTTDFEDSGLVHFDFVKGGAGSFNYSTAVYGQNMESSISIIAEKGAIKVGGQYMNEIEYCHIEDYQMPILEDTLPPNDYGKYKGSAANHHLVIQNVVNTFKQEEIVSTNSLEGLKVVEIIENIYKQK